MIIQVDFLSRMAFEDRIPRAGEAAISIGCPDQAPPASLSLYELAIRETFLDVEAEQCRTHGIDIRKAMTPEQAVRIAAFITRVHALPEQISLIVHCEAGVSRSASVALAAAAAAGIDELDRDASYANRHVVYLLGEQLGIHVPIPLNPETISVQQFASKWF